MLDFDADIAWNPARPGLSLKWRILSRPAGGVQSGRTAAVCSMKVSSKRMSMVTRVWGVCLALGIGVCVTLSVPAHAIEPEAPETLVTRLDAVAVEIQKSLSARFKKDVGKVWLREHGGLVEFYTARSHLPVWVTENGVSDKVKPILAEFKRARRWGLRASDYTTPKINALFANRTVRQEIAPAVLASAEMEMSLAVLRYARHAQAGRLIPQKFGKFVDSAPDYPDPVKVMDSISEHPAAHKYLQSFHPTHPQFLALLKKMKAEYKRRGHATRQVEIPRGPALGPGTLHPHIALVRQRLGLRVAKKHGRHLFSPEFYDDELVEAVRTFQKNNKLWPDGILGNKTRRTFNRKPKSRLNTILANMERWRWMPRNLGKLHIRVNIPEYLVRVMDDGDVVHQERVIVGKPRNKTPMLNDTLELVVFNPYWNVPASIAVKEMLPRLQRDPNYLNRMGYEALMLTRDRNVNPFNINWSAMDENYFPLRIRQPPGAGNALGRIKFLFPNKHSVYMHDTPKKSLFQNRYRAFSHGCVRVRNPKKLAEVIFSYQPGWTDRRLRKEFRSRKNNPVDLQRKIPVHLTYFTAWADEDDGKFRYHPDIYGHDKRLAHALNTGKILRDPYEHDQAVATPRPRKIRKRRIFKKKRRRVRRYRSTGQVFGYQYGPSQPQQQYQGGFSPKKFFNLFGG